MTSSPQTHAKRLANTRHAAAAFVEDMEYIRNIHPRKDVPRAEVRRLSNVLRRLLIEDDLGAIAAPRIGRVLIKAPDNEWMYEFASRNEVIFFASGSTGFFERIVAIATGATTPSDIPPSLMPPDMGEDKTIHLRVKRFVNQRVVYFRNQWISRKQIIKYAANIASGVHTDTPQSESEILISHIRNSVVYKVKDGRVSIHFFPPEMRNEESVFRYTTDALDPVLVEILATARLLAMSPKIDRLEKLIRKELF